METLKDRSFGFWTVTSEVKPRGSRKYWECVCVCKTKKDVLQYSLTSGKSQSCGCRKGKNLSGERFGSLIAIRPVTRGDGVRLWLCRCDCGEEDVLVRAQALATNRTISCGCKAGGKKTTLTAGELHDLLQLLTEKVLVSSAEEAQKFATKIQKKLSIKKGTR